MTKHDRLSRSLLGALLLMRDLDEVGVIVAFTDEPNEKGLIRNLRFAIAEDEREKIRERTMAGRRARVKAGFYVGGSAPFGHQIVKQRFEVNEEEAATIKRAAQLLARGVALAEVAQVLNQEKRLPRQYNPRWGGERDEEWQWSSDSLRRVLSFESLTGTYSWGKQSKQGPITYEIPPILDKGTFARLQQSLAATRSGPRGEWHTYPLSGRLTSPCGMTYSGSWDPYGEGHRVYRCKGKYLNPQERCSCRRLRANTIEEQVWWAIVPLLEDRKRLLELTGLDQEDDQAQASEALKVLDAKAKNLEEAITQRAADALAAGVAPDAIAKAVERLQGDLDAVNSKREKAASWQDTARERKERRARLSALTRASLKLLNAKHDLEFQKMLLALLDVKVEITDDGIKVKGVLREDLPFRLSVVADTAS